MAIKLLNGRPRGTRSYSTAASAAIVADQPLKLLNNTVVAVTPGDKIHFLSKDAKSSADSSTDPIQVVPVAKGQIYVFDVGTGTMGDSYVDAEVDLKTGATTTLDLTASSADDVLVVGWDGIDTSKCYGVFLDTAF
jgi:hypothetical protein